MKSLLSYRFLLPLFIGFAFGGICADGAWNQRAWIESVPGLNAVMECVHYPAMLLFYGCVFLHLGPSGDAGWIMVVYCIIVQWTLVGLILGLWLARRYENRNRIA